MAPSGSRLSHSVLVAPQLQGAATGGIGDSFVLLPRILWCWVSFARAFLLGRLVNYRNRGVFII